MATDSKSVQKAFGKALREARTDRGLSQQELALESDHDRTYISLLERGLRQPTISALLALGKALKTDPTDLLQRTIVLLDGSTTDT